MTVVVPDKPQVFERGDKIYITAPVQGYAPTEQQVEEYAFSSQVKKLAPNENLMWLKGQYVEADQANLNGAQWRAGEIALKQLTPMLMPITVMHDPRTAVGTIADVSLRTPEKHKVPRSRLETALAVWAHRFPEVAAEVTHNLEAGSLMQSMECFSPWYECSDCGMVFHKQPHGAERASWCDHLNAAQAMGYVASEHQTVASRILGDVCFTGTGLIFGSRGAKGALPTADLSAWQDEVAEIHQRVHTDTARTARSHRMGLVQIEETELATLRTERNEARTKAEQLPAEVAKREEAERKLEAEEAAKKAAEEKAETEKKRADDLEEKARQATLGSERMGALGAGFIAKLGDNTKTRLTEQAKSMKDEDWEARLVEVEELAQVKRDAAANGNTPPTPPAGGGNADSGFSDEEIAAFTGAGSGSGQPASTGAEANRHEVASSVGSLVRSMRPSKPAAKS